MKKYIPIFVCLIFLFSCTDKKQLSKDLVKEGIKKGINSDFKNALTDFNKAIDLDPSNYEAYYNRANAYFNTGDYKNALIDLNKAIELNSSYADAYYNRANIKFIQGDKDGACEDYKKSEQLGKANVKNNIRRCN